MITIKLTKKEAESCFDAICMITQDYVESWDNDTRQIQGVKRYFNALESATRKIYRGIAPVRSKEVA